MKNSLSMVMNTVLAMISLLLIFSCSEDENSFENEQLIENNLTKQFTIDNVQLSDIPEIKDYIQTKYGANPTVSFEGTGIMKSGGFNTISISDYNVVQITYPNNLSSYTFGVNLSNPDPELAFYSLVINQTSFDTYSYFVKYKP